MLSGVGALTLITKQLTATTIAQELMFAPYLSRFNLTEDVQVKEAFAWIEGFEQNVASAPGRTTSILQLAMQYLDWFHLQLAQDEIATNVNATLPVYKRGIVPSGSPYEIADADITDSTAASVKAYFSDRGAWGEAGYLTKVSSSPTARQFIAAGSTDNKLTFHSSAAGAPVVYVVNKAFNAIPSIGAATTGQAFGELSFIGKGYGPKFPNGVLIEIPSITRRTKPSLVTEGVPTLEIDFTCNVAAGRRRAVAYYLLPA